MYKKGKGAFGRRKKQKAAVESDGIDKSSAGFKRMQTDFSTLDIPETVKIIHKDPAKPDIMSFTVQVTPDMGYWKGATFAFSFEVSKDYPHKEPKVKCITPIYHPNIDTAGGVCVSTLRPWKPVYNTQLIVFALLFLMAEPNGTDPLNKQAGQVFRDNMDKFQRNVHTSLHGGTVDGIRYEKNASL